MATRRLKFTAIPLSMAITFGAVRAGTAADAPTPSAALKLTPIQSLVEYTIPNNEETAQCTIRPEKENNVTSWVVRNKQGEILRRFADSNSDNVVDQWCYFLGGLEVYRDIDSNFNGKADEYRWFNTAGTRWGVDKNEDGRIDSWRVLSPHEAAEQVVFALKTRDPARFQLLLLTPEDLNALGASQARANEMSASVKEAPAAFSKFMAEQKIVTPDSRFVDFGSARPAMIPAGTSGSTKDVIVCDNSAALVQNASKHDQVFLGTLVSIGDAWKLIGAPSDSQPQPFLAMGGPQPPTGAGGENSPSDDMQKQMQILEELDKKGEGGRPEEIAANMDRRVEALRQLSKIAPEAEREQWSRQLIDVLSIAIQSGSYPKGVEQLTQLQKELEEAKADEDLVAHAIFQRMWAEYLVAQRDPNANGAELQTKWLADLAAFTAAHPKSADTAEALFQLGMNLEFLNKADEAAKWYQQLVANFPNANPSKKAGGALRRLGSVGKPLTLRGQDSQGGAIDIAAPQYRNKAVLIHYWTTLGDRWKDDMVLLKDFYTKKGPREFDIIGICLDDDPTAAKQYVAQNKLPWKQIYESLDGRLANEMGVITLPLMVLVDQKGIVVNPNVHVPELDAELAKLAKPAGGPANALRPPAPLR